jgi:hypothetical protein
MKKLLTTASVLVGLTISFNLLANSDILLPLWRCLPDYQSHLKAPVNRNDLMDCCLTNLFARSKGTDWIYTYLRSFYKDDSRPFGVNNKVLV